MLSTQGVFASFKLFKLYPKLNLEVPYLENLDHLGSYLNPTIL